MPTITAVEARVHDALRGQDVSNAYAGKQSFVFVRLRVRLSDGREGQGFTGRFLAKEVVHFLNDALAQAVIGLDPLAGEGITQRMMRQFNPRGMTGVVVSALSALDIALHDLKAQAEGVSLAALLGGKRASAPVHVTCGFPALDRDALVAACRAEMERGVAGVKMLVASRSHTLEEDIARTRAVRDAIGPEADLIVDANCGFDLKAALSFQRQTAELGLTLFEEPVRANDAQSLHALSAEDIHPISAGQMEQSQARFEQLASSGLAVLQPNAVFAGGLSSVLDVVRLAHERGVGLGTAGGWDLINLHWMCGAVSEGAVELHRAHDCIARLLLGRDGPDLVAGQLRVSDKAGLGLSPDEAALAACAL